MPVFFINSEIEGEQFHERNAKLLLRVQYKPDEKDIEESKMLGKRSCGKSEIYPNNGINKLFHFFQNNI